MKRKACPHCGVFRPPHAQNCEFRKHWGTDAAMAFNEAADLADGGQAFASKSDSGMSLRDYLAAAAITGILSHPKAHTDAARKDDFRSALSRSNVDPAFSCYGYYAKMAYMYADALLEARRQCE